MNSSQPIQVAIIDYGLGNLFSVKHACHWAGMEATITSNKAAILAADVVILPGVGAFGDAMHSLHSKDLVGPIRDVAASGKMLVGICLGLQLMMSESEEFGHHKGLGLFEGSVVRFEKPQDGNGKILKVPEIAWNRVLVSPSQPEWNGTPLEGIAPGAYMYFIHSYYVQPREASACFNLSRYGHIEYCSAMRRDNIFACQYHPERSGPEGLKVYGNLAKLAQAAKP